MHYIISGGPWPCGQHLIPGGAEINTNTGDVRSDATLTFTQLVDGRIPPSTIIPLDAEAVAMLKQHYGINRPIPEEYRKPAIKEKV
jgi:hypothetical protein